MARLRKFVSYRNLERPYTRVSKFREKAFIKITPQVKIVRFDMGNSTRNFDYCIQLISKDALQIRDNAIESARQTSNRLLEKAIGQANYRLRIKIYPFHVLRENPLAAGAGADRFSTGMQKAFGKPVGQAAQVKKGQVLFEVYVDKPNIEIAREALRRAKTKIPCSTTLLVNKLK